MLEDGFTPPFSPVRHRWLHLEPTQHLVAVVLEVPWRLEVPDKSRVVVNGVDHRIEIGLRRHGPFTLMRDLGWNDLNSLTRIYVESGLEPRGVLVPKVVQIYVRSSEGWHDHPVPILIP